MSKKTDQSKILKLAAGALVVGGVNLGCVAEAQASDLCSFTSLGSSTMVRNQLVRDTSKAANQIADNHQEANGNGRWGEGEPGNSEYGREMKEKMKEGNWEEEEPGASDYGHEMREKMKEGKCGEEEYGNSEFGREMREKMQEGKCGEGKCGS